MKTPGVIVESTASARRIGAALTILLLLLGPAQSEAAELKQDTLQAWDAYVRTVNLTMAERATGKRPFLWMDESPPSVNLGRRARTGEVLVASHDLPGHPHRVPRGLIHHWIGAIFLPNVTLDNVTRVLDDYDRYEDFYRPVVVKAKLLERTDDYVKVRMLMMQKAFSVTGAVETDDEIHITKLDANRIYSVNTSVRVQEIANYGRLDERLLPEGQGPGYVWRTLGITRLEQRDGGVYVEMETIALSRGVPVGFRWLIEPLTERLPRNLMFKTLNDTGAAVRRETQSTSDTNQDIARNGTDGFEFIDRCRSSRSRVFCFGLYNRLVAAGNAAMNQPHVFDESPAAASEDRRKVGEI
jgi:hypothetical protein